MISINSSFLGLKLQNSILKNIASMSTSLQRLMTGLRVNSAADDPAGFYISSKLATQIRGLEAANTNIQSALSMLNSADKKIEEINGLMGKIRELVQKSTDEYLSDSERKNIQNQINTLFAQVQELKDGASHGGNKLFSSSTTLDKNATYYNDKATTGTYKSGTYNVVTTAAGFTLNRLGDLNEPMAARTAATVPLTSGDEVTSYIDATVPAMPEVAAGEENQAAAATEGDLPDAGVAVASYDPEEEGVACYDPAMDEGAEQTPAYDPAMEGGEPAAMPMMMSAGPAAYDPEMDQTPAYDPETGDENVPATMSLEVDEGEGVATPAYNPEDEQIPAYDPEMATGEGDETEPAAATEGDVQVEEPAAMPMMMSMRMMSPAPAAEPAAAGGDETMGEEGGTEYVVGDYVPLDGYTPEEEAQIQQTNALVQGDDQNAGIATAAATSGSVALTSSVQTITIGNNKYDVSGAGTLSWSVSAQGQILFSNADTTTTHNIYAREGQVDNVAINGSKIIFSASDMNDKIEVKSGHSAYDIYGDEGDDTITIYGASSFAIGGDGDDTITNNGTVEIVQGGNGNDYLVNNALNAALHGEVGDDTIINNGTLKDVYESNYYNVTLDGGEGNDYIVNNGTINDDGVGYIAGRDGVDTVINNGKVDGSISLNYDFDESEELYLGANSSVGSLTISQIKTNFQNGVVGIGGAGKVYYNETLLKGTEGLTSGSITLDFFQDQQIKIGDKYYNVSGSNGQKLNWSVDANGQITFKSDNSVSIVGIGDSDDNVVIDGTYVSFEGGAGNDRIEVKSGKSASYVAGGDGDDTIINAGTIALVTDNAGDDKIDNKGNIKSLYLEEGDDTLYLSANSSTGKLSYTQVVNTFNEDGIVGVFGAEHVYDKNGNLLGGAATNSSGSISLTENKTTIQIGDKYYDVYMNNPGETGTLNWSVAANGQITFSSSGTKYICVTAHSGQEDNVSLDSAYIGFFAGDMDDTIEVKSGKKAYIIYGEDGNDVIVNNGSIAYGIEGDAGDDSITNNGWIQYYIKGADGNDSITNNGNMRSYLSGGAGDDVLINSGSVGTYVNSGSGDDEITNNGVVGTYIKSDTGNDVVTNYGSVGSYVNSGGGNDVVINNGSVVQYISGGAGDDSLVNNGSITTNLNGNDGNDTLENHGVVSGSVNGGVQLEDGADDFVFGLNASVGGFGTNNIQGAISGGSINDVEYILVDLGTGSGDLTLSAGEQKVVMINGNKYLLENTNTSSSNVLTYATDATTGQITLTHAGTSATDTINVTALDGSNQADNINFNIKYGTLNTGDGNDTVTVSANYSDVDTGDGADSVAVTAGGKNSTIALGAGDDTITNAGRDVSIDAGYGNDSVVHNGSGFFSVIELGAGNDTVVSSGSSAAIYAGDGDDSVVNSGASSIIDIGFGSDTVSNTASSVIIYQQTDGTDDVSNIGSAVLSSYDNTIVFNPSETKEIEIDGKIYTVASCKGVLNTLYYKVDAGVITLYGENFSVTAVDGSNQADNINFNIKYGLLNTGDGNDTVTLYASYGTINAGDGADFVTVAESCYGAEINGEGGNDVITNNGGNTKIDAGEGNDSVVNSGSDSTIALGAGNDTVTNSANNLTINGGDDFDTVYETSTYKATSTGVELIYDKDNNIIFSEEPAPEAPPTSGSITVTATTEDTAQEFTVGGKTYYAHIEAESGTSGVITYSYDETTGKITFESSDSTQLKIISKLDQKNDVIIDGANLLFRGGDLDDKIEVINAVVVNGFGGNDYIVNNGNALSLNGHIGNDTIINIGKVAGNINADAGDDSIVNYGSVGYHICGGDGDDTIENRSYVGGRLGGDDGDDEIYNYGSASRADGNNGNDYILNNDSVGDGTYGVAGQGGNDTLVNNGVINGYLNGDAGNDDRIFNYGVVTNKIDGGAGEVDILFTGVGATNGSVSNIEQTTTLSSAIDLDMGGSVSVDAGAVKTVKVNGNYYRLWNHTTWSNKFTCSVDENGQITMSGSGLSVFAMAGQDDNINFKMQNSAWAGVDGNDSVISNGVAQVINSGVGSDTVRFANDVYAAGTIVQYDKNITFEGATEFTSMVDEHSSIRLQTGTSQTVTIGGKSYTVESTYGNSGTRSVWYGINKETGKVYFVGGEELKITAASGQEDYVVINTETQSVFCGGDGNDTIIAAGVSIEVKGEGGNDTIVGIGYNNFLWGGAGDDEYKIIANGDNMVIARGDGIDTVEGQTEYTSIIKNCSYVNLDAGKSTTVSVDGKNYTIKNQDTNHNRYIAYGIDEITGQTVFFGAKIDVTAASGQDDNVSFKVVDATFNTGDGNDTVVNTINGVTITGGAGKDSVINLGSGVTVNTGDGDDTLVNKNNGYAGTYDGGAGTDKLVDYVDWENNPAYGDNTVTNFENKSTATEDPNKPQQHTLSVNGSEENPHVITIGDFKYDVVGSGALAYTYDENTKQIEFISDAKLHIIAHSGQADNVIVNGDKITFSAGDEDDIIIVKQAHLVTGIKGDDTIINNGVVGAGISGGTGNDSIVNNGSMLWIGGDAGDDTIVNNGKVDDLVHGGNIADGDNSSNDHLYVGANSSAGSISGVEYIHYPDGSVGSSMQVTAKGQENAQTLTIGDKSYYVYLLEDAPETSGSLNYKVDVNGVITFSGNNDITSRVQVRAFDGQNDNVILDGNLTFNGSDLDDTINILNAYQANGGDGNDYIVNNGTVAWAINGQADDDTIINHGKVTGVIKGEAGDDSIVNYGSVGYHIIGGDGDDTIVNETGGYVGQYVQGNIGDDSIINKGNVGYNITGASGNDEIYNYGTVQKIGGNEGNDYIQNNGIITVDIYGKTGDDTIVNNNKVNGMITGDEGNDEIYNNGSIGGTIYADAGNDYVLNNSVVGSDIYGGSGNDTIVNNGTVGRWLTGHEGNDLIYNNGNVTSTLTGDDHEMGNVGNDTLFNGAGASAGGKYLIDNEVNWSSATNLGTGGSISIAGGAGKAVKINGMYYYIENGRGGTQTVTCSTDASGNIVIDSQAGNISVIAAAGQNDKIKLLSNASSVDVGDGNDSVIVYGLAQVVKTGAGDDTINFGSNVYANGAIIAKDNDVTFVNGTELTTMSDEIYSVKLDIGGSKTVTVNGKGYKINNNLADAQTVFYSVNKETGLVSFAYNGNVWIESNSDGINAKISGFDGGLAGSAGNDTIINAGNTSAVHAGTGNDLLIGAGYADILVGNDGDDTFEIVTNKDAAVVVTGSGVDTINGAGEYTAVLKTAQGVSLDVGASQTITVDGKTYTIVNKDAYSWRAFYYGVDVITGESVFVGRNYSVTATSGQDDNIKFGVLNGQLNTGDGNDSVIISGHWSSIATGAGNDSVVNLWHQNTIKTGDGNDTLVNKLYGYNGTYDGGAGTDKYVDYVDWANYPERPQNTVSNFENKTTDIDDSLPRQVITVNGAEDAPHTIQIGDFKYDVVGSGALAYTYDETTKQIEFISDGTLTINAHSGQKDNIILNGKNLLFNAGDEDDTIIVKKAHSLAGGAGNDSIVNNGVVAGKIYGTTGDDTIVNNGSVGLSIEGEEGADVIYNNGYVASIEGGQVNYGPYTDDSEYDELHIGANSSIGSFDSSQWQNAMSSGKINGIEIIYDKNNDLVYGEEEKVNETIGTSGTIDVNNTVDEPHKIIIDDKIYYVVGNGKLTFNKDEISGQISFIGSGGLEITADEANGDDDIMFNVTGGTLNTGSGNDNVINNAGGATINTGDNNDTVTNNAINSTINLGAGADSLTNIGANANINAGAGSDTIMNSANNSTIDLGADNDHLTNLGANANINAGAGNDNVINTGSNAYGGSVEGGDGDDTYTELYTGGETKNEVSGFENLLPKEDEPETPPVDPDDPDVPDTPDVPDVPVNPDETIATEGSVSIDHTDDNPHKLVIDDKIYYVVGTGTLTFSKDSATGQIIFSSSSSLKITAEANQEDNIIFNVTGGTLNTGNNADNVTNMANGATINLGSGADNLTNLGSNATINAGSGNDTVLNTGANAFGGNVDGGIGNDTYTEQYTGDGTKNEVTNFETLLPTDTPVVPPDEPDDPPVDPDIPDDPDTPDEPSDPNVTIGTSGTIGIGNTVDNPHTLIINGKEYYVSGEGELEYDYNSSTDEITFSSTDGLTITAKENQKDNIIFDVAGGTLNTGDKDDTIKNIAANTTINSGSGADSVVNSYNGSGSNINTGDGNDTISNAGADVTINAGENNDVITNSAENTTISAGLGDDTINLTYNADSTVVFTGGGEDVINGATDKTVIFDDGGVITLGAQETEFINIKGYIYEVRNLAQSGSGSLSYTYDVETGRINFTGKDFYVKAGGGQVDRIDFNVEGGVLNTNGMDDNVAIYAGSSVSLGAGNDTLVIKDGVSIDVINGDEGNDKLFVEGLVNNFVNGGEGDDTLFFGANASVGGFIYEEAQEAVENGWINDVETITNGTLNPDTPEGGEDDVIVPTSGSIGLNAISQVLDIFGNKYDVTGVEDDILNWSYNKDTQQITFQTESGNNINITAHSGQVDNVVLNGQGIIFDGSDLDDIVSIENANKVLGGDGNDSIINNGTVSDGIYGGSGNDTIVNYSSIANYIKGQDGDDYILHKGLFYSTKFAGEGIDGGSGDDTLIIDSSVAIPSVSGDVSSWRVYGREGNDEIHILNDSKVGWVDGNEGNDTIINDGYVYHGVKGWEGDDSIVNNGQTSSLNGNEGDDTIVNNGSIISDSFIRGELGDDLIINNGSVSKIYGSDGADTITNNGIASGLVDGGMYGVDDSSEDVLHVGASSSLGLPVEHFEKIVAEENSGAFSLKNGQSVIFEIDGKLYTIKNTDSAVKELKFEIVDGQVKFESDGKYEITAHSGQADNVLINGANITFDAGDMADKITVQNANIIKGGAGNDTLINSGSMNLFYGDDGDDVVKNNGTISGIIYGGNESTDSSSKDELHVGSGSNYGATNGVENIVGASNKGKVNIEAGDTIVVTIDGKKYDVTNWEGTSSTLEYSVADGKITFDSDNAITISAHSGQRDNVIINGAGITFDAGDLDDEIEVLEAYNINAGAGNDVVKNKGTVHSAIEAGAGDDYVINDGVAGSINGGAGNDNLIDNYGGTTIFGDVGDDYIVLNGDSSEVYGGDGKDTIFLNGTGNISDAGNGDDMTYMYGSNNIASGGTDGYDKVANKGYNSTYSGMNELVDKSIKMSIQTDYKFTETSMQDVEIGMNFQNIKLDVSSKDSAASTLAQLDEMILGLTSSRVDLAFQSELLNNKLEYNLARISNLNDTKSSLIDADTALEYNNLIAMASLIEKAQLIQAQLQQGSNNAFINLLKNIAG